MGVNGDGDFDNLLIYSYFKTSVYNWCFLCCFDNKCKKCYNKSMIKKNKRMGECIMEKKKIIKICLIVLAIVVVLALVYMIRNYIIAKDIIDKNVAKAVQSESIHTKTIIKEGENVRETFDNYKKGNKELTINIMNNEDGSETKISMYTVGTNETTYYENKEGKFVEQEEVQEMPAITEEEAYAQFEKESKISTFFAEAFTSFKTVKIDGKDCYLIEKSELPIFKDFENGKNKNEIYVDKETGLIIKTVIDDITTEYIYEFDNVNDVIFTEPDISEYEPYI